jgi:hypothetical protein
MSALVLNSEGLLSHGRVPLWRDVRALDHPGGSDRAFRDAAPAQLMLEPTTPTRRPRCAGFLAA